MNYLLDGRCEISNNSAERKAKVYATGRKNFLFHDSVDGAKATAIVISLVETAKANNLNAYKYLYTLLLYMPDYKNEPAGIKQLLPWSTFVQDKCSGIIDDSLELPENRGNQPIQGSLVRIPVWLFIAYNLFLENDCFRPVIYNNMRGWIHGIAKADEGTPAEKIIFDIKLNRKWQKGHL